MPTRVSHLCTALHPHCADEALAEMVGGNQWGLQVHPKPGRELGKPHVPHSTSVSAHQELDGGENAFPSVNLLQARF